jgi:excinuclease ABC subunit A
MPHLKITNARTHNLKNISLELPHNKLIVFSGISGSGKSSLVYDVIFREGERLFLQSLGNASKTLFRNLSKPDVDAIEGLRPVIAVGQDNANYSARSTVGTITDVYGFLRLLFARFGKAEKGISLSRSLFSFNSPVGACPQCHGLGQEEFIDVKKLIKDPALTLDQGAMVITTDNGYIMYSQVTMEVLNRVCTAHGFSVSISWNELTEEQKHIVLYGSDIIKIPYGKHTLESRMKWTGITARPREEGIYKGIIPVMEDILRRDRNDNILRFVSARKCQICHGTRLNAQALNVLYQNENIAALADMSIARLHNFFGRVRDNNANSAEKSILAEILKRLDTLIDLDMGDVPLSKPGSALLASEKKAIRLMNQLFGGMENLIYVFDEPAAGLHPATARKVFGYLQKLRDDGNTVLVIEHNPWFQQHADLLVDIGPLAGIHGGEILFVDTPQNLHKYVKTSITARMLVNRGTQPENKTETGEALSFDLSTTEGKATSVTLLNSCINVVTGIRNSGRDVPLFDLLVEYFSKNLYGFSKVITIDSGRVGKTSRSTPATYTGIFDAIRRLFASESGKRFSASDFSFNNPNYSCPECGGTGFIRLGMHFLGSAEVVCPECQGKRYVDEILTVTYQQRNISQILDMSVDEATHFFENQPKIHKPLLALQKLGCGYLSLGQSTGTLSGGEAQRVKLAGYLSEKLTGQTLFLFDNPVSGMHTHDALNFIAACRDITSQGHTVLLMENTQIAIENADYILELARNQHGTLESVFAGNAAQFQQSQTSTAKALYDDFVQPLGEKSARLSHICIEGAKLHNLKNQTVTIPKNKITVITGPSGSGKTTLAFDTLYAEARNRYLNNFSSYIREKIGLLPQTNVEAIHGLIPAIAVSDKMASSDKRSTVGTASGMYDLYRLFYARFGENRPATVLSDFFSFNRPAGACPTCTGNGVVIRCDIRKLVSNPPKSLVDGAMDATKTGKFFGEPHGQYVATLLAAGKELKINFLVPFADLSDQAKQWAMYGLPDVELAVEWHYKRKTVEGTHHMKTVWKGFANLVEEEFARESLIGKTPWVSEVMSDSVCPLCHGARLKPEVLAVTVNKLNISQLTALSLDENILFFETITESETFLVRNEILRKLHILKDLGLSYLSLSRHRNTLSAGESRRLDLAALMNSGITGTAFIADEPSLGLGDADIKRFNQRMQEVKNAGNTVVLVDHHPDVIRNADYIIEFGTSGGQHGGRVVAKGTLDEIAQNNESLTRRLLDGIPQPQKTPRSATKTLKIYGTNVNNLNGFDVEIPTNALTVVCGPSGSGKSSLVLGCVAPSVQEGRAVGCQNIDGELFNRNVVIADGLVPQNHSDRLFAEFVELFDPIKKLFAAVIKAEKPEINPSALSFRSAQGRCPECKGKGVMELNLDFVADSDTPCGACGGKRYSPEILRLLYQNKTISDVLELTIDEAISYFDRNKAMAGKLLLLQEIGLGYLTLGQEFSTLSGGEIRRAKLAKMLFETKLEPTLICMDEPSSGLFFTDIERLLVLFERLLQQGHTLLVAEHNRQIIQWADCVIGLPYGG